MQRMNVCPGAHWSDKVMSVLREQQLEACQERLTRSPERGLFDDITPSEMKDIYPGSFYAAEAGGRLIPTPDALRRTVMDSARREAMFLSEREDGLIKRMVVSDGQTVLDDWEDISAAEALVRRLWCVIRIDEEQDTATLTLQQPLLAPVVEGLSSPDYPAVRQALFGFNATLHALLYISGFLHAQVPARHFLQQLAGHKLPGDARLVERYLQSSFEYCRGEQDDMLLVHPGLYDPETLLSSLRRTEMRDELHLTPEMMLGGMNGMLPEEAASARAMAAALHGALRPEVDEDEALEDLRMMAKQGATLEEMREVLEGMLCVLPTPRMLSALRQLHLQTVRWIGMPPAVLN